jgi:K+/H+ antiporter YhaU regulatory subunit KhtT
MSYASTGASSLFNILKRGKLLFLAEGLDVFNVPVPASIAGRTLAECKFRQSTGCNVIAIEHPTGLDANPKPDRRLSAGEALIVVGDAESEERFFRATQ